MGRARKDRRLCRDCNWAVATIWLWPNGLHLPRNTEKEYTQPGFCKECYERAVRQQGFVFAANRLAEELSNGTTFQSISADIK